ncbi:serine/arginine-rich splicing factor 4 [Salvia hispanica]|uniref:serine/arginine-rich splicing factor 4 n=1 Tax=Salvia hispanica TaxID=49212 RepID=UPI002009CA58|nr:serine/arginine-rich splicing factor 4 [Salvia hispanica]
MEDEKLAAYYDDLTRRGGGAARFKQGLGFSSNNSSQNDDVPSRGSALPAASSFLSSFVRESSPSKTSGFEKQAQLQSIQNKLSKKPKPRSPSPSPSRHRIRAKHSNRRSTSRSPSRDRIRDRNSERRSPSRTRSRRRSRSRSRERNRERSRRHGSPEERWLDKGKKREVARGGARTDFAKLIGGYDDMTPAERVKAKMKLQLSKTAENDETIGKGSGWERFEFDKDAPLDDDEEEIEAADDDAALVKKMGQSFHFSAVSARKEEEMKALHDDAIFGVSSHPTPPAETDDEAQVANHGDENVETAPAPSLLSNQVLTRQKGSWRDRVCKR